MNQWSYRDGADEAPPPRQVHRDPRPRHEFLVLSMLLSIGVVGWLYLVHLWIGDADHRGLAALDHGMRDVLMSLPLAFAAVGAGQWLARRLGATGTGPLYALSRAMIISLVFTALTIPSVGLHEVVDGFLGGAAPHAGEGLEHDSSAAGLALHGLRDAMIGEAAALPLLFVAIVLLSGGMATSRIRLAEFLGTTTAGSRGAQSARPGDLGPRPSRPAIPVMTAATLCLALVGGIMAIRIVAGETTYSAEGRIPTSFGALWLASSQETSVPKSIHSGMVAMPQHGSPDQVTLEVVARLANTTSASLELTPASFALRLAPNADPIAVKGAGFESIRLLPGAIFDARVQFPIEEGGEYRPKLLFDDPDGPTIAVDMGQMQFQNDAGGAHDNHNGTTGKE